MPPRPAKKAAAKKALPAASKKAEAPVEIEKSPAEENADIEVSPVPETEVATEGASPKAEDQEEKKENAGEGDEVEDQEEAVDEDTEMQAEEGNEDNDPSDEEEEPEDDKIDTTDIAEGDDGKKDADTQEAEGEKNEDGRESEDGDADDADKGEDASYLHTPSEESRKRKEVEIFVRGLNSKVTEDDLVQTFSAYGEVKSARIARNSSSKKSKGFAFIQFGNVEQAKKVLVDLKDGIEVQGKCVSVSASTANDTLYVGNICKTWTADQIRETLKSLGVEHAFEMLLPSDPATEGSSKGFAFLEFSNHLDAMDAFQCIKSPGACFGRDKRAKVAFAHSVRHLNEDVSSEVKTVYVDGLPSSWDEEKIKDLCSQYGQIERVELSRNFSKKKKRKDFGFIAFASRESAMACVEGINSGQVGEGECKLSANLAKSERRVRTFKPSSDEMDQSGNGLDDKVEKEGRALPNKKVDKSSKQKKAGAKTPSKNVDSSGAKKRKGKFGSDFGARPNKRQRNDKGFGNSRGRASRHQRNTTGHGSDMEPHAGMLPAGGRGHTAPRYDFPARRGTYAAPAAPYAHSGYVHHPVHQASYPYAGPAHYPPRRAYY